MALPRTRLDKLVQLRERAEDDALAGFARARAALHVAREHLDDAVQASRVDARSAGPVELWVADDHAHRRAVQAVHAAQSAVRDAARGEESARDGWLAARQEAGAARRARERKLTDLLDEAARRERRTADEIATLKFNAR
jgi:flagellar export protein FliJ